MKLTKRMPSFEGVAAGSTATLRLPIGLSYEQLLITFSGVTLAEMSLRLMGNGKQIQTWKSGELLDLYNQFNGRPATSDILILDFTRFGNRTRGGEEFTKLGTGAESVNGSVELTTLALEIDIAPGASAPLLGCKAVQSEAAPLGFIKHVRQYTHTATAIGELEISDIPKGHLFNQMHFITDDMENLRIEREGYVVFDRSDAENRLIQEGGARVPQTGIFSFDPTELGNSGETLQTSGIHDLRYICDMSAMGSLPVIVESIAPLN
jgi:hypothetical protein